MPGEAVTIGQVLRDQALDRAEHPLLICDAERISYFEAERRSALTARGLVGLGAGKGTHVGLLYPNGVAFVVAMLAAARIGAVVVPFSTFATSRELREQLADSDTQILLSAPSFRSHDYVRRLTEAVPGLTVDSADRLFSMAAPQLRHVIVDTALLEQQAEPVDEEFLTAMEDDVEGCDPATIVYTSGTTSAPKGVLHTHASLIDHQRNLNAVRRLTAVDRLFCNSPFFWIGGLGFALLASMIAGATLVCSNADDPGRTLDLLEAEKPTVTNGFVAGIRHLAQHPSFPDRDVSSMRRGNLYPIMSREVRPLDPELRHNMLGMTEAGSVVLLSDDDTDQPEHRRRSFGKPAPGIDVKIVDPETRLIVEPGAPGEFCIRGPSLMQRYYKRSREDCFDADGWLHTGDLVTTDNDGFFYYLGRRGSMIKTAGANVSPSEVEQAITGITGCAAFVLGVPDPDRGQAVAAVVVVDNGAGVDESDLRRALAIQLSAYKIPRRFVMLAPSELPLLASGKPDLARLKELFDA
ncbi:class I adenylate-forming enzyme family protein [Mycobacterium paraterrae]|uniref:Acyl--CoA ligase n=1 Tax=Mycobacterium paraterrae TaxID=577492 RepID=A0ABY3VPP8_9MYCO|nr:class I adenylate-forming enzyme family protein [Mycobacterium paraterrae]UMB71123.1 acyl--CoA ligase [Mycobacterium paraterrae]